MLSFLSQSKNVKRPTWAGLARPCSSSDIRKIDAFLEPFFKLSPFYHAIRNENTYLSLWRSRKSLDPRFLRKWSKSSCCHTSRSRRERLQFARTWSLFLTAFGGFRDSQPKGDLRCPQGKILLQLVRHLEILFFSGKFQCTSTIVD